MRVLRIIMSSVPFSISALDWLLLPNGVVHSNFYGRTEYTTRSSMGREDCEFQRFFVKCCDQAKSPRQVRLRCLKWIGHGRRHCANVWASMMRNHLGRTELHPGARPAEAWGSSGFPRTGRCPFNFTKSALKVRPPSGLPTARRGGSRRCYGPDCR